jgi:membrane protease YdiL (CAAX protease family)
VWGLPQTERVPWWKWLLLSLGVIALVIVVACVAMVALVFHGVDVQDYLYLSRPAWITNGWVGFWLAAMIIAQTTAPVAGLALFRPTRLTAFALLRCPADGRGMLRRLLMGACLAFAVQWVWMKVGPVPEEPFRFVEGFVYAVAHGGSFWPWFWLLSTAVVAGPVSEEILYRGYLQTTLRRRWGLWAGMVGSALLFGVGHGLVNALPTALLGLYFSYQVEKDQSLAGAVLLHAGNNLVAVLVMALQSL